MPEPGSHANADALRTWLDDHTLATGTLTGLYAR
jgi:hypothetical protein